VFLACLGTLASAGFLQGTQFLAATFAPAEDLASFAAAVTLVAPIQFLPRALALAMFPSMSAAHGAGDRDEVRRQADLSTRGLLAVLTPLFVAGIVLAPEILVVFGGDQYIGGALVLQLILAGAFISVIQVGSVNALSSAGGWQLRIPVGSAVTGALVGLAVVVVAGPALGSPGVAGAYVLGTVATAAGPIAAVWRRQRMSWGAAGGRAILCMVMSIFVAIWMPTPEDPTAALAVHGFVALVAVVAALAILRGDIRALIVATRVRTT
jgi:O-antigen/teichoic acid export membrane protein